MKLRRIISLLLALVLMFSVVGCGGNEAANTDPITSKTDNVNNTTNNEQKTAEVKLADKQEIIYVGSEIETMDPAMAGAIPNWGAQAPVYENLLKLVARPDNTSELVPGVAESYDISEDGLVYTFHLRKDAKWSDGVGVTAKDFVYAWQRVYDPKVGHVYSWMVENVIKNGYDILYNGKSMDELGVVAKDDYTVEFTLASQSPFFLQFAAFPTYKPVRKDIIEKFGTEYGSTAEKIVGNGAYIVTYWDDTKIVYEPNEHYWNKSEVYLTKITRQNIKEVNAVAQALLANEVDIAGLNKPEWNTLVDATGIYNVQSMPDSSMENFIFNCDDPVLKNQKIRLALSLALDREKYNNEYLEGLQMPAYSMCPTVIAVGKLNYNQAVNKENEYLKELSGKYDAKQLLIEGMQELGLGDDPSKLTLTYMTRGTTEWSKKSAEWLKQFYESTLGINFVIEMTEWNVMYKMIDSGEFQITQGGWTGDYDDPSNFLDTYDPKTGYYGIEKLRWTGEGADLYSKCIEDAKKTLDDQERANLYSKAEKILLEQAPVAPMYSGFRRTLVAKNIDGYYINPNVYIDYVGVKVLNK